MNDKNLTMMLTEEQRKNFEETITVEAHPLDNYAMLHIAARRYPGMTVVDFVEGVRQDKLSIVLVNGIYFDRLVGKQIN